MAEREMKGWREIVRKIELGAWIQSCYNIQQFVIYPPSDQINVQSVYAVCSNDCLESLLL